MRFNFSEPQSSSRPNEEQIHENYNHKMKFSTQEEYGLRCLLQIARRGDGVSMTIPEISQLEGLSNANVAKLMRLLRLGGFVTSERGHSGGYSLAQSPEKIIIGEVLALLGGKLVTSDHCNVYAGIENLCTHSIDCSIFSLWNVVQYEVDKVLRNTTLKDLLHTVNSQPNPFRNSNTGIEITPGKRYNDSFIRDESLAEESHN